MSADIIIRNKLRPTREHGSILLYVHGNHKARSDGKPRTATSTLTQPLNSGATLGQTSIVIHSVNQRLLRNRPGSDTCDLFFRDFLRERLRRAFTRAHQPSLNRPILTSIEMATGTMLRLRLASRNSFVVFCLLPRQP